MWVILSHAGDVDAAHVARQWPDTRVLTPRDLSRAGWRHMPCGTPVPSTERAVVEGEVVAVEQIDVVLSRLDGVGADELTHIVPEDRDYVAAEMNAFLLSWLTRLTCPVLNKPVPLGLAGAGHRPEGWAILAGGLGIATCLQRRGPDGYQPATVDSPRSVTLVGDRCFGDPDPELRNATRMLGRAAGVELMTAVYDGAARDAGLYNAYPWTDLSQDGVPRAQEELLRERARPRGTST